MRKRLPIILAVALVAPTAAALAAAHGGGGSHGLQDRIAQARARESRLSAQIDSFTSQIRALEARAVDVSARLTTLERDLSLHRGRLSAVRSLLELQTRQLRLMREQYAAALERLNARLVSIYKADEPTTVDVLLAARSFDEVVDSLDYLNQVATQDKQVAVQFGQAKIRVRRTRASTARMQARIAAQTQVIAYRTEQQAALRARLLTSSRRLASSRSGKRKELASTKRQEQEWIAEANALARASAEVSAQIQGSSASSGTPPSSSGLAWPLSGTITSPYGMRWGSLHPGIDVGAPSGTPIRAAASGVVLIAAYSGGYGYLVVIDHGNGIATAYAHQSQLAASAGQRVAQGQVIGYVGSTGFSTGPHLHFEVRVNGSPVDPLGYL